MSFDIVGFLRNHTLLHGVPETELENAASTMETVCFPDGEWMMHEGEEGNDCYFVLDGKVQVYTRSLIGKQVVLAELGYGALIGEITLIRNEKRTAGIRALGEVTALRLDRTAFEKLAEASPYFHESLTYAAELRMKHGLLRKASIWSAIPDSELRGLAEITVRRNVLQGENILREGTPKESFYMISSGRFEITSTVTRRAVMETGDFFGEIALLAEQPQSATITAMEDGELLVMGSAEFQAIWQHYAPVRRQFAEVMRIRRPDLAITHSFGAAEGDEIAPDAEHDLLPESPIRSTRWIDLLFLLGGLFAGCTVMAVWLQNQIWQMAALLAGGLVGPVTFVAYIRGSQQLGFSHVRLAWVFVLSAAVAIPLAWVVERQWLFGVARSTAGFTELSVPLSVALIEEGAKLIVCAILLRGGRMRFLMDAVVIGAAAGMGFAAVESMFYGWSYLERGSTGEMLAVLWVRALLSPLGHGTWTAIAAAGIWLELNRRHAAQRTRFVRQRQGLAIALLLAAIALHALWDFHFVEGLWRLLSMVSVGAGGLLLLYVLLRKGTKEENYAITALNPLLQDEALNEADEANALKAKPLICGACKTQSPRDARYCARCGQALRRKL
ncbi:cyclic nucleotide-binding domain-containing protein [Paenibacillus sp. LMG 31456]|uniref:Cyclic nucleotide-binding domain-containing protein n=1 Tax=Paenibacillus foliorum TaxID=2654974 RepID=A0A972GNS5_9BACL|nr:cyclic nucleotide-binding domain-containing protein [Paenibacillus foliorum]NOU94062.1 cyclic nucleotide-binding domain-containing protein [Paenibacillus foliorum]